MNSAIITPYTFPSGNPVHRDPQNPVHTKLNAEIPTEEGTDKVNYGLAQSIADGPETFDLGLAATFPSPSATFPSGSPVTPPAVPSPNFSVVQVVIDPTLRPSPA